MILVDINILRVIAKRLFITILKLGDHVILRVLFTVPAHPVAAVEDHREGLAGMLQQWEGHNEHRSLRVIRGASGAFLYKAVVDGPPHQRTQIVSFEVWNPRGFGIVVNHFIALFFGQDGDPGTGNVEVFTFSIIVHNLVAVKQPFTVITHCIGHQNNAFY